MKHPALLGWTSARLALPTVFGIRDRLIKLYYYSTSSAACQVLFQYFFISKALILLTGDEGFCRRESGGSDPAGGSEEAAFPQGSLILCFAVRVTHPALFCA